MRPSLLTGNMLLAKVAQIAVATAMLTLLITNGVMADQIRCRNAGVEVYEGQSGVISTTCFSFVSRNAGGISVAPDQFFITGIEHLGDPSDTINETADQLRANFTFPGSSHPGFVEPPAPGVPFADVAFRLNLPFTTTPVHHGGPFDSGTVIINGFVLWTQIGGGIASRASDPFSLVIVVRDVPEPGTASLLVSGVLSLALINLRLRYRRRTGGKASTEH